MVTTLSETHGVPLGAKTDTPKSQLLMAQVSVVFKSSLFIPHSELLATNFIEESKKTK
jgi:hypothetical protein